MIALYERVSTSIQAEEGYSIGEQQDRLEKYCEAMGWRDFKHYTDAGFTGANIDRPALEQLIRDTERGKIKRVVVYKLDRLSRSQKDTLYLIEDVFLVNGCDFVSISENFDTASPFGKAMIGLLAVFAQLEREQIKERMKMGKTARAKKGLYNGSGYSPFGYDFIGGKLVTNDYEKMQVQMIFDMYESGKSATYIANYLIEHGYKSKAKIWHSSTIHTLLENKIYIGLIKHHDDYYPGEHEAIISQEQWENVQRIKHDRSINNERYQRREGRGTSYLGGFVRCGLCGSPVNKVTQKSRDKKTKEVRWILEYYGCNHRTRYQGADKCTNKIWRMKDLDELVFNEIRKLRLEPIEVKPPREVPKLDKQISKLNGQIEKLLDLYSVGGIPLDKLQDKIEAINDQREKLESEQDRLNKEYAEEIEKRNTLKMIDNFEDIISSGDVARIRLLISTLIEKIVVTNDDIDIFWRFN